MKKFLLLCTAIFCLFSCTNDEAPLFGDVYGVVYDSSTGTPVYNASVTLSPTNKTIVTGRDGHFEFNNLDAGAYKINVTCDGYESNSSQITVVPGERVSSDIHLFHKSVADLLVISPTNLNFGTTQTQMSVEITNNSSIETAWSLNLGENRWIKASPISGRLAAGRTESIVFTCNRSTVTAETSGIVRITVASNTTPISIACSPSEQVSSQMEITPLDIDFGGSAIEKTVRIKNTSSALLNWTLSGLAGSPITASSASGTIQPGNGQDVDLVLDRSKITSDFVKSFIISDGTNKQQINVYASSTDDNQAGDEITISAQDLDFGVNKSSLTFTVTTGSVGAEVGWKNSLSDSPISSNPHTAEIGPNSAQVFTLNLDRSKFSGSLESAYKLYVSYEDNREQDYDIRITAQNTTSDQEPKSNEIFYTTNNGVAISLHASDFDASVTSHTYSDGKGVIVFSTPITIVGEDAFAENDNLKTITLPNSIKEISYYAFCECTSLESINIPESVTTIEEGAFEYCLSLKTISLPSGLKKLGWGAFFECRNLTSIELPEGIEELDGAVFSHCEKLTSIRIPSTVKEFGGRMFFGCESLQNVTFPDNLTSIPYETFYNCTSLTTITIPKSVTSIEDGAFSGCTALKEITLPESLTTINDFAFAGCGSLVTITIPDNVISIGRVAFYNCTTLKNIVLPKGLTTIAESMFQHCSSLESIIIPKNVTKIENDVFYGCTSLIEIIIEATTPPNLEWGSFGELNSACRIYVPDGTYSTYTKSEYWSDYAHLIANPDDGDIEGFTPDAMPNNQIWYISSDRKVIEPNYSTAFGSATIQSNVYENGKGVITFDKDVTTIGAQAFSEIGNLTRIIIPKSVTSIKDKAFYCATDLSSIIIPENVTSIGKLAFDGCNSMSAYYGKYASDDNRSLVVDGVMIAYARVGSASYSIPEGVVAISDKVFEGAPLNSVTLPNSLKTIGNNAFYYTGITEITLPENVTSIGEYAFSETPITKITSNATNLESVGKRAFDYCRQLQTATFKSIKNIGVEAFNRCDNLKSVTLPDTETIGTYAFRWCGLTELTLPKTLKSVEHEAFSYNAMQKVTLVAGPTYGTDVFIGCKLLTEVVIDDNVSLIPEGCFRECGVKKVTIPNSVIEIGANAFACCGNLKEIMIPGTVETIGRSAFRDCTNLLNIRLNEGTKNINDYAFNSSAIYSITIPKSVVYLGDDSFSNCANLSEVYCPGETPASMKDSYGYSGYAFNDNASDRKIYVPETSVEAYKEAWPSYADAIEAYDFSAE